MNLKNFAKPWLEAQGVEVLPPRRRIPDKRGEEYLPMVPCYERGDLP